MDQPAPDPPGSDQPVPRPVRILYRRPPDRSQTFRQVLVHDGVRSDPPVLVTYLAEARAGPIHVDGRLVLEQASPVVWFTFPGARHDIGRFHTADGAFTGFYANILTPVEIHPGGGTAPDEWRTTDLFLDVFLTPDGDARVLDRDELEEAVDRGWLDHPTAREAEAEARRLVRLARAGEWPPAVVDQWPLERARAMAGSPGTPDAS